MFKVGDKILCVDEGLGTSVKQGEIYTVIKIADDKRVEIEGLDFPFSQNRFKLVEEGQKTMMEVGKKYKCFETSGFHTCVGHTTKGDPILEYSLDNSISKVYNKSKWKEYVEPRTGVTTVYIYAMKTYPDKTFVSPNPPETILADCLAVKQVTWTEGDTE